MANNKEPKVLTTEEFQKLDSKEKARLKEYWIARAKSEGLEYDVVDGQIRLRKKNTNILTRRGQIEEFWNRQPFYYDKSKIFWLWNLENKKWERSDEEDYLNSIQEVLGSETIDGKTKSELISGFKQIGRKHKPKNIEKSWIQFKDKIYDVRSGEEFEATPEYFITNPIPFNVGKNERTPTIDRLFIEWVGEKDKQSLYEFIAYCISLDKFMQRIFAYCGGGSNGKGTFIKLVEKFLGEENCVVSDIKSLSENRFETARIYRKLLCVMGEVAYDDLKNTNILKKLGGEDKLSFEFKGKDGFTDDNTATCVCLTNSLPTTPDKSMGFYRKWKIEDFPNQFKEMGKALIEGIPEVEFENLAKKSLRILKELYENPKFHNEGTFEEREVRYEERSNPVMRFVEERCEEIPGRIMILRDFTNLCNEYLKEKHLRILTAKQIGKIMRDEGFSVGPRRIKEGSAVVILNLALKSKLSKLSKLSKSQLITHRDTISNLDSFDSNDSNPSQNPQFTQEEIAQSAPEFKELLKNNEKKDKKPGLEKEAEKVLEQPIIKIPSAHELKENNKIKKIESSNEEEKKINLEKKEKSKKNYLKTKEKMIKNRIEMDSKSSVKK